MAPSLGVVIPAYRPDVPALATLVDEVVATVAPDVVRIELDAASPATVDRLRALDATVSAVDRRRGKGAAITHGFEASDTDVLAFVDADGSVPAASLAAVVEPVTGGRADLAVGSRRHPDADVRTHQSFLRRRLGDAFAALARLALDLDLYDYQCGAKAIDRDTWTAVRDHLYEPGFGWDVELIAMVTAVGARVTEVPVTWIDRPESTVDTADAVVTLGQTLLTARRRATRISAHPVDHAHRAYHAGRPALVDQLPAIDD